MPTLLYERPFLLIKLNVTLQSLNNSFQFFYFWVWWWQWVFHMYALHYAEKVSFYSNFTVFIMKVWLLSDAIFVSIWGDCGFFFFSSDNMVYWLYILNSPYIPQINTTFSLTAKLEWTFFPCCLEGKHIVFHYIF